MNPFERTLYTEFGQKSRHHANCYKSLRDISSGLDDNCTSFVNSRYMLPRSASSVEFDLACLGCCIAYLCTNRQYLHFTNQQQSDIVTYDRSTIPDNFNFQQPVKGAPVPQLPAPLKTAQVGCRLEVSNKRGHIVTALDSNLGTIVYQVSPGNGRTYRVYGPRLQQGQKPAAASGKGAKKRGAGNKTAAAGSSASSAAVPGPIGELGLGAPTFPFEAVVRLESVAVGVATPGDLKSVGMGPAAAAVIELYRSQRKLGSLKGLCVTKPPAVVAAAAAAAAPH